MCCSDPPPPPDLSASADASTEIAQMQQESAREQLAWAREQDTMNRATLDRVLGVQLPAMEDQARFAKEDRARYEETFKPLQDAFIQEAQGYDTTSRRQQEQGRAVADVNSQFDAQRRNAMQRLEGYGIDPSQTRSQALDIGVRTAQAATAAQAGTNATRRVEDVGRAMRGDAINLGMGLPTQAAQGYAGATGTGAAAIGGANQTTNTGAAAAGSSLGFSGQALGGFGQTANIQTQGYQNQMDQYNAKQAQRAGTLQGIGAIGGMAFPGLADGGNVNQAIPFNNDGPVPEMGMGDGSGIDDTVPAQLSEGEFVIPADVVRAKGEEFFERLIDKYHTPAAQQEAA